MYFTYVIDEVIRGKVSPETQYFGQESSWLRESHAQCWLIDSLVRLSRMTYLLLCFVLWCTWMIDDLNGWQLTYLAIGFVLTYMGKEYID